MWTAGSLWEVVGLDPLVFVETLGGILSPAPHRQAFRSPRQPELDSPVETYVGGLGGWSQGTVHEPVVVTHRPADTAPRVPGSKNYLFSRSLAWFSV